MTDTTAQPPRLETLAVQAGTEPDPTTKADKLAFILADCEASAILIQAKLMPVVAEAVAGKAPIFVASTVGPNGQCPAGAELRTDQRSGVDRIGAQHASLGEQHLHTTPFDAQYRAEAKLGFGGGDPALTRYEHHSAVLL